MGDRACGRPPALRSEEAACLFSGAAAVRGHRHLVSLVGGYRLVVSKSCWWSSFCCQFGWEDMVLFGQGISD